MFAKIYDFFATLGAAQRAAAAVEARQSPSTRDLERLGINAGVFGGINRA